MLEKFSGCAVAACYTFIPASMCSAESTQPALSSLPEMILQSSLVQAGSAWTLDTANSANRHRAAGTSSFNLRPHMGLTWCGCPVKIGVVRVGLAGCESCAEQQVSSRQQVVYGQGLVRA